MRLHYCIATRKEFIGRMFNAAPAAGYLPRYNAVCDQFVPAVMNIDVNALVELKWNFPWQGRAISSLSHFIPVEKMIKGWKQTQRIRSTLLTSVRERRCAVPANCFVVWQGDQAFCIYLRDQRQFAFAGVWNETSSHTGFALLTQPANEFLQQIGQTEMPLILREQDVHRWLSRRTSVSDISGMLKTSYLSLQMNGYAISALVADPSQNSADIFNPQGERLADETVYTIKGVLHRQGWGRPDPGPNRSFWTKNKE